MKEKFFFECLNCGNDWEQILDDKKFLNELKKKDYSEIGNDGKCPQCGSTDILIGNQDGKKWNQSDQKFENKFNLKSLIEKYKNY